MAATDGQHAIDRAHAGVEHGLDRRACQRVDLRAGQRNFAGSGNRAEAIERPSGRIEHTAEQAIANRQPLRSLLARRAGALLAASGTTVGTSRTYIQSEFSQLISEISSIATGTRYSGQSLLDGTSTFSAGVSVLVGSSATDTIDIKLSDLTASTLGVSSLDVSTQSGATAALTTLDTAIDTVSKARADIGAQESRFNFSADSISTQTQNLQSANSAIKDVDIASEQAKLSSAQVKTQAAVSAEAAANQIPQYLLKLLG